MDTNLKEMDEKKEYETPTGTPPWHSNAAECLRRIKDRILGEYWYIADPVGQIRHARLSPTRYWRGTTSWSARQCPTLAALPRLASR